MSEGRLTHRSEIDGLRALAVLPVIWHHASLAGLPGGFLGVDVFFVISGYLITGVLLPELLGGTFSITRFYERRARRLLPALILTLAVCVPLSILLLLPGQLIAFGESLISVSAFVSNIYFWRSTNYFAEAASLQPLLHTWSLAVEEQFYLFYPLLLLALLRFSKRSLIPVLVAFCLGSLYLSIWASEVMPVANFYLLPTRAWELLAGALCVFVSRKSDGFMTSLIASVGLTAVITAMIVFDESWAHPGYATLMVVLGACSIIAFTHRGKGVAGRLLIMRPLVGVGLISYSAYLFHQPLMAFARIGWSEQEGPALMVALCFLTLVLAALSWRYVEQPFRDKVKPRLKTRTRLFTASLAVSIATAAVGGGLIATQGLVMRYLPEDRELALFDRQAAGDYVRDRFNTVLLQSFELDARPRLLLIGDSFGQDFFNILAEAGVSEEFSISTHHVSKHCGNLLVADDLSDFIPSVHAGLCVTEGGLRRSELQPLLATADVVVLASNWQPWQLEYLVETHQNLSSRTKADVYVLGRKDFGLVRLKMLLNKPVSSRIALRNPPTEKQEQADMVLREALGPWFIDLQAALCPDDRGCPLFTPEQALISYDGGHLTRAGAHWAGRRVIPLLPFVERPGL